MRVDPSVPDPTVSTTSQTKAINDVPVSVLPTPPLSRAVLRADDYKGYRKGLTSQLLHGSMGIAKAGPQLILHLKDLGQGHLIPGGGEQEVRFQNYLYAKDSHLSSLLSS